MKILTIILLSIFTVLNAQTENYYVIKIKGEIHNETSGKTLKQGDAIKSSDKLKFNQKSAVALVISDTRGRFTLKFPERMEESAGALTVFVKSALISHQQNRLSTRSLATKSAINHLDDYFGQNDFIIIGDELELRLSKKYFPISLGYDVAAKYFIGEKEYTKILSTENQTMVLSRTMFEFADSLEYSIKGLDIYKRNISANKEELITNINLNFVNKTELEKEFLTIIEKFNDGETTKSKIRSLLVNYFYDFYGKTDDFYLNQYTTDLIIDNIVE